MEEEEEEEDFAKIHSLWPPAFQHQHIFSILFVSGRLCHKNLSLRHRVTESILINQKTTDV